MILEGKISVKAAVLANRRKVETIYIDESKHDREISFIKKCAKEKKIRVIQKKRYEIDALAEGKTHGGILAEADVRTYQKKEETLAGKETFIVVIEGVEDPFNLGYIARSLYCAGCTGLVLRKRQWDEAEKIILKSSAGAFEYINVVMSEDIPSLIHWYKEQGIECFAAMRKNAISCYEENYRGPILLAIGGEMRGLSSATLSEIQKNIFIPYANAFKNALNASGAASVLGFEVFRQRHTEF